MRLAVTKSQVAVRDGQELEKPLWEAQSSCAFSEVQLLLVLIQVELIFSCSQPQNHQIHGADHKGGS